MKARPSASHAFVVGLLLVICGGLCGGCKSTPKIDWNSRVGNYTYDMAVEELGPPDKTATLSDGSTVADWIKRSNSSVSFGVGTGYSSGNSALGVGTSTTRGYADKVLRLTFDAEHKLISWSKNY